MRVLILSISVIWLGSQCCSGFTLTKVDPSNLVYQVIEDEDGKSLTISNPKLKRPTLREIIYYHIIEKPFLKAEDSDDEITSEEVTLVSNDGRTFTNGQGYQFSDENDDKGDQSDNEKLELDIKINTPEDKLKRSTDKVSEDLLKGTPIDATEVKTKEESDDQPEGIPRSNLEDREKEVDTLEDGKKAVEDTPVEEKEVKDEKRQKRDILEDEILEELTRPKRETQYGQRLVPPTKLSDYVKNILSLNAQKPVNKQPETENIALKSQISSFKDAVHSSPPATVPAPGPARPKTYGMVLRGNDAVIWNNLNGPVAYHVGPSSSGFEDLGALNSDIKDFDSKESNEVNFPHSSQESFENVTYSHITVNGLEDNKNSEEEVEENSNESDSNNSEQNSGEDDGDFVESNEGSDEIGDSETNSKEDDDKSGEKGATNGVVDKIDKIVNDIHDMFEKSNNSIVLDKDKAHVPSVLSNILGNDVIKKEEEKLKPSFEIKSEGTDNTNIVNVLEGLFTKIVKNKIVINNNAGLSEESDKIVAEKDAIGTEKPKKQVIDEIVKITPEKDEDSKESEKGDGDLEKPIENEHKEATSESNTEKSTTENPKNIKNENNPLEKPQTQKDIRDRAPRKEKADEDLEKDSNKDKEQSHNDKVSKDKDAPKRENKQPEPDDKEKRSDSDKNEQKPLEHDKKIKEESVEAKKDVKEESEDVTEAPKDKIEEEKDLVQDKENETKDSEVDDVMDLMNNDKFWDFMGDLGKKYIASLSERTKNFIKEEIAAQIKQYFEEHKSEFNVKPEKEVLREKEPKDDEIKPQKHKIDVTTPNNTEITVARLSDVEESTEKPIDDENNKNNTNEKQIKKASDVKNEENKLVDDKSRNEPSFYVKANTIYGNSVGSDKVTNVYIFYGSKNLRDIVKNVKDLVDGSTNNVFTLGPQKGEEHVSHKKDRLNKDSHSGADKKKHTKHESQEKLDEIEVKDQTKPNEDKNSNVDLVAQKDTVGDASTEVKDKSIEEKDESVEKKDKSDVKDEPAQKKDEPAKKKEGSSEKKDKSVEKDEKKHKSAEKDEKKDKSAEKDEKKDISAKKSESTDKKHESSEIKDEPAKKKDEASDKKDESVEKKDQANDKKDEADAKKDEANDKKDEADNKIDKADDKNDKADDKKDKADDKKGKADDKKDKADDKKEKANDKKDKADDKKDESVDKEDKATDKKD